MNKIAIVDTYYPAFLNQFDSNKETLSRSYSDTKTMLMEHFFGTSDAYSSALCSLGWQAEEIVPNFVALQTQWATANSIPYLAFLDQIPPSYLSRIPLLGGLWTYLPTLQHLLDRQIDVIAPDVVYFQDLNFPSTYLLKKLRKKGRLVVGQIASPLPPDSRLRCFDLIVSSLPNIVDKVRSLGVNAEFLPIAFDSRVLDYLDQSDTAQIGVSFIGGITPRHRSTIPLLEAVARICPELRVYGYGAELIQGNSILTTHHHGERWGLDMYDTLRNSKVTLNRHIDIAESFANNMRLFEATGVGTLLVTDNKSNIRDYFEPGVEILTYDSPQDAAELCRWSLDNRDKAEAIARAGQERTLCDHTYAKCMVHLDSILRRYM